jgi:hypothetical protein
MDDGRAVLGRAAVDRAASRGDRPVEPEADKGSLRFEQGFPPIRGRRAGSAQADAKVHAFLVLSDPFEPAAVPLGPMADQPQDVVEPLGVEVGPCLTSAQPEKDEGHVGDFAFAACQIAPPGR